jgi:hypothetical protein
MQLNANALRNVKFSNTVDFAINSNILSRIQKNGVPVIGFELFICNYIQNVDFLWRVGSDM